MNEQRPPVNYAEFTFAWIKCIKAMDSLIMEKGYDALTLDNICERSGLNPDDIETYFFGLPMLLQMHDSLTMLTKLLELHSGKIKPE